MQKQISSKITALTFGILIICFAIGFYVIAWQEPSQTPPGGNVPTPINVGTAPQAKAGRLSATEFYDYNDPNYYLNPSGDSKLDSITIVGGTSLPTCDSSKRGKQYLLQSGSGIEDGLYVCKKKKDDTYAWIALASPPKWVSINYGSDCVERCKISYETGGSKGCCCVFNDICYGVSINVSVYEDGTRQMKATKNEQGLCYMGGGGRECCGVKKTGLIKWCSASVYNIGGAPIILLWQ